MSDFDHEQADYWFTEACRRNRLLGSIEALAYSVLDGSPLSPETALEEIRRRLTEHDNEQKQSNCGGRRD